jgi:hypothetical protein
MEALPVEKVPLGAQWQYEPKWDGFRCIAFKDGETVELQSKSGAGGRTNRRASAYWPRSRPPGQSVIVKTLKRKPRTV